MTLDETIWYLVVAWLTTVLLVLLAVATIRR